MTTEQADTSPPEVRIESLRDKCAELGRMNALANQRIAELEGRLEASRGIVVHATTATATANMLLEEALTTMSHAEIFICTREKMHPTGQVLWTGLLDRIRDHLYPEERQLGSESAKLEGGV